eukprot:689905-Hanusia_phi.AAC.1
MGGSPHRGIRCWPGTLVGPGLRPGDQGSPTLRSDTRAGNSGTLNRRGPTVSATREEQKAVSSSAGTSELGFIKTPPEPAPGRLR